MIKRLIFLVAIIISLVSRSLVFGASAGVVINSFMISSSGKSTEEFVEIYNAGSEVVQLKNWRLVKKSAIGTTYNLLTSFPEFVIDPQKSVIIAHKDYSGEADLRYSVSSNSLSDNNTIILYSDAGSTEVDKVGWGTAKFFESQAISNPKSDEIWERKEIGMDTDNNLIDFKLYQESNEFTPGSSTFDGESNYELFITEFMPNPIGSDSDNEWVEIYNAGLDVSLGGLSINDKFGTVKSYNFPSEIQIKSGQYYLLPLKGTGVSLNNDGDALEIKDSNGTIVATSGENCGKSAEGISYAFDGEKWQWTKNPTPGSQNIIEIPPESTKQKATKKTTTTKKAKAPKAQVKGSTQKSEDIFAQREANVSANDKKIGIILIVMALVFGLAYTVYNNWSKIRELYIKKRKEYHQLCQKIRQRSKKG